MRTTLGSRSHPQLFAGRLRHFPWTTATASPAKTSELSIPRMKSMPRYQSQAEHCFRTESAPSPSHPPSPSQQFHASPSSHFHPPQHPGDPAPVPFSHQDHAQSLPLPLPSDHQRAGWQSSSSAAFTLTQQEHKPLSSRSQPQERPFLPYPKDHRRAWFGNGAAEYPK